MGRIKTGNKKWHQLSRDAFESSYGFIYRTTNGKKTKRWYAFLKYVAPTDKSYVFRYKVQACGNEGGYVKAKEAMMAVEHEAVSFAVSVVTENPNIYFIYPNINKVKKELLKRGHSKDEFTKLESPVAHNIPEFKEGPNVFQINAGRAMRRGRLKV